MRFFHFAWVLVIACALAAQEPAGLSPKAGAVSDNLYTNLFFGFNLRFPQGWDVSFVASEGPCTPECMLLDVRASEYPKLPRSITISVEPAPAGREPQASAALAIEKLGGKRLAPVRELQVAGRKLFRVDYRSMLADRELYQSFLVLPDRNYLIVFNLTGESRRQLDGMADDFARALTFTGKI